MAAELKATISAAKILYDGVQGAPGSTSISVGHEVGYYVSLYMTGTTVAMDWSVGCTALPDGYSISPELGTIRTTSNGSKTNTVEFCVTHTVTVAEATNGKITVNLPFRSYNVNGNSRTCTASGTVTCLPGSTEEPIPEPDDSFKITKIVSDQLGQGLFVGNIIQITLICEKGIPSVVGDPLIVGNLGCLIESENTVIATPFSKDRIDFSEIVDVEDSYSTVVLLHTITQEEVDADRYEETILITGSYVVGASGRIASEVTVSFPESARSYYHFDVTANKTGTIAQNEEVEANISFMNDSDQRVSGFSVTETVIGPHGTHEYYVSSGASVAANSTWSTTYRLHTDYTIGGSYDHLFRVRFIDIDGNEASLAKSIEFTTEEHGSDRYGLDSAPRIPVFDPDQAGVYNTLGREISLCIKVKPASAMQYTDGYTDARSPALSALLQKDIISYDAYGEATDNGISVGSANAGTYTLVIPNESLYKITDFLKGGNEQLACFVFIGIRVGAVTRWQPFGAWFIDHIDRPEQGTTSTIQGVDALGTGMMDLVMYRDQSSYNSNCTANAIMRRLDRNASSSSAPWCFVERALPINGDFVVSTKPAKDWEGIATVRSILSELSKLFGGFFFVDRMGRVKAKSFANAKEHVIPDDNYIRLVFDPERKWVLENIYLRGAGNADSEFALMSDRAYDGSITHSDAYDYLDGYKEVVCSIIVEAGPLLADSLTTTRKAMMNVRKGILLGLNKCTDTTIGDAEPIRSGDLEWVGDPNIELGDVVKVRSAIDGKDYRLVVLEESFSFDGGGMTSTISGRISESYFSQREGKGIFMLQNNT